MPGTRRAGELTGVRIRPLVQGDDLEAEVDLSRRAFGPVPPDGRSRSIASARHKVEAGQILGAFDGNQLVGTARFHAMKQWWHGRSMPMAGVAGVKVAPEYRGRGVGRGLMTELIAQIAARGYPVSALYPATAPLYRSLGWEVAGGRYELTVPMDALARLLAPDQAGTGQSAHASPLLQRASPADAAAVTEVLARVYSSLRESGPATHEPAVTADWLDDEDRFSYLAADGFLSYGWADGTRTIRVDLLAAASASTARQFWQLLAMHGSMASTVRACLAPDDPVSWLTTEPAAAVEQAESWMVRVVDVRSAIEARGFPSSAEVCVQLELADDVLPGNAGRWRLDIAGGRGKIAREPASTASPADSGTGHGPVLRLGARGLAALYAGVPLGTIRRAGLAGGGDEAGDDALDGAFGGRPAFMLHEF